MRQAGKTYKQRKKEIIQKYQSPEDEYRCSTCGADNIAECLCRISKDPDELYCGGMGE